MQEIVNWPEQKKAEHLAYMFNTIQSAFEFVDYVFEIKNVSRALTHQLVRTRPNSYQQESMRTVDVRDHSCLQSCDDPVYAAAIEHSLLAYGSLVDKGYPVQDIRGILPTAIHTKITAKVNLRSLSDMALLRLCKRAEGEYQQVFKMIVEKVLEVHPWAAPMLQVHCIKYGVCAFPRYKKCPVQKFCAKPEQVRPAITNAWASIDHVATPKAIDGMTM